MLNQANTPQAQDGYVLVRAAEYDRLIALSKLAEAEQDIEKKDVSPVFGTPDEALSFLNSLNED